MLNGICPYLTHIFSCLSLSGSVAPRQLTDVAKSKRTFERNQFRHAKVSQSHQSPFRLHHLKECIISYRLFLIVIFVNFFISVFLCRVERATGGTMRSWSSISTRARARWAPAPSADRELFLSCVLVSLRSALFALPYNVAGWDNLCDVIFVNIFSLTDCQ